MKGRILVNQISLAFAGVHVGKGGISFGSCLSITFADGFLLGLTGAKAETGAGYFWVSV